MSMSPLKQGHLQLVRILRNGVHACGQVVKGKLDMANMQATDGNNTLQKCHALHHVLGTGRPHRCIHNTQNVPGFKTPNSQLFVTSCTWTNYTNQGQLIVQSLKMRNGTRQIATFNLRNVGPLSAGAVSARNRVNSLRQEHIAETPDWSPSSLTLTKFNLQRPAIHCEANHWPCLSHPNLYNRLPLRPPNISIFNPKLILTSLVQKNAKHTHCGQKATACLSCISCLLLSLSPANPWLEVMLAAPENQLPIDLSLVRA